VPSYALSLETTLTGVDPDFEESGSYQRLVAALVDARALPVEPDRYLRRDSDSAEALLELQLAFV
jgi:hypothetical protein